MKNGKFLRTTMLLMLSLVIIGSVIGGTIAWFTDEVASTNNIIKTGTLDIEMSYADSYKGANTSWTDASSAGIFNYKLWEPGYTQVRYVKIDNAGDLALKFQLNIKPSSILGRVDEVNGEFVFTPAEPAPEYALEDQIDVYVAPVKADGSAYTSFEEIKAASAAAGFNGATIRELIADKDGAAYGVIVPANATEVPAGAIKGTQELCVALHMKETAGNEYQNLSIGDGFAIQLQATQYTYEKDSFNDQYDADATYANLPTAVVIEKTFTEEELNAIGFPLQTAYAFRTTDTPDLTANPELKNNPYLYWHADFVVSFDKDVAKDSLNLAGQYDAWNSSWLSFPAPEVKANTPIRLLGDVGAQLTGSPIYVNYMELIGGIQQFNCGAYNNSEANNGTTMTVELRLYETKAMEDSDTNSANEETGRYETLGSFTYTFNSVAQK